MWVATITNSCDVREICLRENAKVLRQEVTCQISRLRSKRQSSPCIFQVVVSLSILNLFVVNFKPLVLIFFVGFKLGMIGLDYCAQEMLKSGMCHNVIRAVPDGFTVVNSDYGLIPVPDYAVAITSIKVVADAEYDRYHQDPDPEYDTCIDGFSCLNGGKIEGRRGGGRGD